MRLVPNSHPCGSGRSPYQAGSCVLLGFACRSGLLLSMALSGSAGKAEPQVQCRAPEVAVPPWAAAGLRKTDSLEVKVKALLAVRRQRIGYEKQIEAAVSLCR